MLITIYKLECIVSKKIYIGSTQRFKKRMWEHKTYAHRTTCHEYNTKLSAEIRAHGWANFTATKLTERYVDSTREKFLIESVYMETFRPELNSNKSWCSKDDIMLRRMAYYQQNRKKICSYVRGKRGERIICECGLEIARGSKLCHLRSKQHREWLELAGLNE